MADPNSGNGNGSDDDVELEQILIHVYEDTWYEETDENTVTYGDDVREVIDEDSVSDDDDDGNGDGNGNGRRRR